MLSKAKVAEIKKLLAMDMLPQPEVARLYDVSRSLISDIAVLQSDFEKKWESEGTGVTHAAWRRVPGNRHQEKA